MYYNQFNKINFLDKLPKIYKNQELLSILCLSLFQEKAFCECLLLF